MRDQCQHVGSDDDNDDYNGDGESVGDNDDNSCGGDSNGDGWGHR